MSSSLGFFKFQYRSLLSPGLPNRPGNHWASFCVTLFHSLPRPRRLISWGQEGGRRAPGASALPTPPAATHLAICSLGDVAATASHRDGVRESGAPRPLPQLQSQGPGGALRPSDLWSLSHHGFCEVSIDSQLEGARTHCRH